jgi:hypothetical protein
LTATPATQDGDCCFCVILHVEELPAIPRATSAGAAEIADVWGISAGDGHHSWVHLLHTESLELATSCQKPLEYMRGLLRSERALSVEKWVTALAEELGVSGWPFDRAKLAQRQGAGSFEHGQEWMRWRRPGVAELPGSSMERRWQQRRPRLQTMCFPVRTRLLLARHGTVLSRPIAGCLHWRTLARRPYRVRRRGPVLC